MTCRMQKTCVRDCYFSFFFFLFSFLYYFCHLVNRADGEIAALGDDSAARLVLLLATRLTGAIIDTAVPLAALSVSAVAAALTGGEPPDRVDAAAFDNSVDDDNVDANDDSDNNDDADVVGIEVASTSDVAARSGDCQLESQALCWSAFDSRVSAPSNTCNVSTATSSSKGCNENATNRLHLPHLTRN